MILHKLPPFQNVAADGIAVISQLPLGMTYYGIRLKLGGTALTKAMLSSIKLRLGGKQFMDISGSHLDDTVEFMKGEANAAYLTIYFAEPQAKTIVGEMAGAIDTSIYGANTAFELEVTIAGATAPTLEAWAMFVPPKADNDPNKATIRALLKTVLTPSAAAEHSYPLPIGSKQGSQIKRVFAFHGGNVTKLQVTKDGLFLLQEGEIALLSELQDEFWREEQANLEVIDFCMTNNQSDVIATLRKDGSQANFEWKFTTSAGDTITAYTDLYTTIDRV